MAIDIPSITTITDENNDTAVATGVFDRFMLSVRAQISDAVVDQEITQSQAGEALAGSIVGVLAQSIQFELEREKSEWMIDAAKSDADKRYVEMLASISKQMGFDYTLDADGEVVRSSLVSNNNGIIDHDRAIKQIAAELDTATKADKIAIIENEKEIGDEKVVSLVTQNSLDTDSKANKILIIENEKQIGDEKVVSLVTQNSLDTATKDDKIAIISKELEHKDRQLQIAEQQLDVAVSEASQKYAEMIAKIDKIYGMGYTLDVNDEIVRSSLVDDGGGSIDYDNTTKKIAAELAQGTKQDKIDTSGISLDIATGTKQFKIDLSKWQTKGSENSSLMTEAQTRGLEEQVIDNRYIKAINSLSSVYGTFGAGGLNVSDDQWQLYYKLISSLVEDLRDYKGQWDASGAFAGDADGTLGDFWVVSAGGNTVLDGISNWVASAADRNPDIAYYDGNKWKKISGEIVGTDVIKVPA